MRWKRIMVKDNHGKRLDVFQKGDYEIALNINRGHKGPGVEDKYGDHWLYEVTCGKKVVGEKPSLPQAKKLAEEHARG